MAGHSKWSNIKRKKGAQDQKRGKIFTRCIHEVTVAVREGGGADPDGNPRLRYAIEKAKSVNVPNETIERAIKRATGELADGEQLYELTYEGYGPSGVAILVEVVTNNKNRSVSEVRHAFSKNGGSLGENGCVQWMFEKKGVIVLSRDSVTEDEVMLAVIEAGADDVSDMSEVWEVICDHKLFHDVRNVLTEKFTVLDAEVLYLSSSRIEINKSDSDTLVQLMDALDDIDDVINVFSNADIRD
jgi:YebC/PmpR family DNA-binding regulatory protein